MRKVMPRRQTACLAKDAGVRKTGLSFIDPPRIGLYEVYNYLREPRMANTRSYPVLAALISLRGYTVDRKPSVIKVTALAKASGLTLKEVKAILADNDGCVAKNEKGSIIGVKVVAAACEQGMVLRYRDGVQGSSLFRQFFHKGKRVGGTFNLDTADGRENAGKAAETLEKEHGVPLCRNIGDMTDAALERVWKETRR